MHFLLITEIASYFSLQTSKCYLQFLYFQFILYAVAKLIFLEHKSVTPLQIKPIVSQCQRNKLKTISLLLSATIIWLQTTFPLRSGLPIQRIRMTFTFTTDGKENNVARGHKKFKFQQFFFFLNTITLVFLYIFYG